MLRCTVTVVVGITAALCLVPAAAQAQSCNWNQISLYVDAYYSESSNEWTVFSQGEDLAAGCCGHLYNSELSASTATSTHWDVTDLTVANVTRLYNEAGDVDYSVGLWINCECVQATVAFAQVSGRLTLPAPLLPNDEYSTWVGWYYGSMGKWSGILLPSSRNFYGRFVREFDGSYATDYCYIPQGAVPKAKLTGGTWQVYATNVYGDDYIGWDEGAVIYYRANADLPCHAEVEQNMKINVPGSTAYSYKWQALKSEITSTDVMSDRGTAAEQRRAWP